MIGEVGRKSVIKSLIDHDFLSLKRRDLIGSHGRILLQKGNDVLHDRKKVGIFLNQRWNDLLKPRHDTIDGLGIGHLRDDGEQHGKK